MTSSGTAVRAENGPEGRRLCPWNHVSTVLAGVVLLLAVGGYLRYRAAAPELPVFVLEEADPAVRASIQEALGEVRRSPRSAATWGKLGMVLLTHDFLAEALVCLSQAERLDPKEARWPYYQGVVLSMGDPCAAIPKLERAVALCGGTTDAPRLRLAELLLDQDRQVDAEEHFRQLLRRDPGHARAHLGLARLSSQRDDLAEALTRIRTCMGNLLTRNAAAALLAATNQRIKKAPAVVPRHPMAMESLDDPAWPDAYMEEVEQLKTGRQGGIARMERLLVQERVPEAIQLLQEQVRDNPDSNWAWLWLGRLLIQQEQFAAAEPALREAARRDPGSADAQFYFGIALYCQGRSGQARSFFRRATMLKPDYALAHYNLGHCLIQQGERPAALAAFRMAVRCKANFADAHVNLGDLLVQEHRYGEGLVHLRYAAQLHPGDPRTQKLLRETLVHLASCIGP